MTGRLVSVDNLGAWLVKCNADNSDIAHRAAREPRIDRWCVRRSYRTALMRPGQRVVFWVSGGRGRAAGGARVVGGIWAVGYLASEARPDPGTAPPVGAAGERWHVELDLRLLPEPDRVSRERLRADPRLAGLEVFRQPQAANPSVVTVEQLPVITDYVTWPAPAGR